MLFIVPSNSASGYITTWRNGAWTARLSSGVSSWKMRGTTTPVLVEARNTLVMPLGVSPFQLGPTSR